MIIITKTSNTTTDDNVYTPEDYSGNWKITEV